MYGSENALSSFSSDTFLRTLETPAKNRVKLSPRSLWNGGMISMLILLLVSEEGCAVCSAQAEVPEKIIHP